MKDIIGIIGQGFVGSALRKGMEKTCATYVYDKFKTELLQNVSEVVNMLHHPELKEKDKIVFVCVPTPMFSNGKCDISIVESVVKEIDEASSKFKQKTIVVIKSTIPPGTTEYLDNAFDNVSVIFNPEFLREASPFEDFINQNRIILGGKLSTIKKVANLYRNRFPNVPIIGMESKEAEMVKYVTNCFLATKVSFANEIFQICKKMDISYEGVISAAIYDERLGKSHWSVPGPDGSFGYGGHCFPKDLNALTYMSKMLGIEPVMLGATWKKNLEVRTPEERDWEKMKGRAVSIEGL